MTRGPAHLGAALAIVLLMLSVTPALAATKKPRPRARSATPMAVLGWSMTLLVVGGAVWAAAAHLAPQLRQDPKERARVTKLLAELEQAQRARFAERERSGLRRRRPLTRVTRETREDASPEPFEGGFSFGASARAHDRSSPAPRPAPTPPESASGPEPEPPVTRGQDAAASVASEQLAILLEAITVAERRLEQLRAELSQASSATPVAGPEQRLDVGERDDDLPTSSELLSRLRPLGDVDASEGANTIDLGLLDMPGGATLDLGKLDVPDEVLERLRALSEIAVSDGTVDLGPLELPGGGTLTVVPRDLLARLHALSAAVAKEELAGTINLAPPDLPAA